DPADLVDLPNEPEVNWISVENKTRAPEFIEDRAAHYDIGTNTLVINGDFRVFTDIIERWDYKYEHVPASKAAVKQVVREWFEQQLVETVMSALALKGGKWSLEEMSQLWSDEALTAAVLPRYHIDGIIKRSLGQKLGKLSTAA